MELNECRRVIVEADRKSIKNIVFWFTEDDGKSAFSALPKHEEGRTVSQVRAAFFAEFRSPQFIFMV